MLFTRLKVEEVTKKRDRFLIINENATPWVFDKLILLILKKFNGRIIQQAGGIVTDDIAVSIEIKGNKIYVSYQWPMSIWFRADADSADLLLKIKEFVETIKINKLRLWISHKING